MNFIFIIANKFWDKWLNKCNAAGQAWFCIWILIQTEFIHEWFKEETIRHESIHIKQQRELLSIGWYIIYIGNFIYEWIRCDTKYDTWWKRVWHAYMLVIFEREAYAEENNLTYLTTRGFWAWRKF